MTRPEPGSAGETSIGTLKVQLLYQVFYCVNNAIYGAPDLVYLCTIWVISNCSSKHESKMNTPTKF